MYILTYNKPGLQVITLTPSKQCEFHIFINPGKIYQSIRNGLTTSLPYFSLKARSFSF